VLDPFDGSGEISANAGITEGIGCSKACEGGIQERSLVTPAQFGGKACPGTFDTDTASQTSGSKIQTQVCNNIGCPGDCQIYPWSECSAMCTPHDGSSGTQSRQIIYPKNGGQACPANTVDVQECNKNICGVDCVLSDWGMCTAPDGKEATCGPNGKQFRTVIQPKIANGAECSTFRERSCNTDVACPVDCKMSKWSACNVGCGGGLQRRSVIRASAGAGVKCAAQESCPIDSTQSSETSQESCVSRVCNTEACIIPVNCEVSEWSRCSTFCGGGIKKRRIVMQPGGGGEECPLLQEECNIHDCTTTTTTTHAPIVVPTPQAAKTTSTTTTTAASFSCNDYTAGPCVHEYTYLCEFDFENDLCVDIGTLPEIIAEDSFSQCEDYNKIGCKSDVAVGYCKWIVDRGMCEVRGGNPVEPLQVFTVGGVEPEALDKPEVK
jgi:hypothetical protein